MPPSYAATSRSSSVGRRPGATAAIAFTVILTIVTSVLGAGPAHAQVLRSELPVVAGTRLEVPGGKQCTVGAVLRATGIIANISQYSRGIRYLLIAKHCAQDKAEVKVGDKAIGVVTWRASDDDLALVRVDPNSTRRVVCSGAYQLHRCTIVETITPRALGRVILDTPFSTRAVPMRPAATPGGNERFCTSGSTTGVNCSWIKTPTPATGYSPGEAAAANTDGVGVLVGDSGGPVVGTQGQFYGIIVTRGIGANLGLMGYIPSDRAMRALGSGYTLADPN